MPLRESPTGVTRVTALLIFFLLLAFGNASILAQQQPPPPPDQTLTADQLNDLVAPIALYPDPLLSQVVVAATYPLEVVQAFQWLQKNPGRTGPALTQAAQEQNWDASIQALVVFPDVLRRLNDDITWTTNLGNAFLAQQQDVMDAVQRMRQSAQEAGKLASTPQQQVVTQNEGGRPYIEIVPADPEVIYVPVYDPVWIWGPPVWYPYPHWWWPPRTGGLYFGFGGGINIGLFFGGGWHGWDGWGWHPGWGNRTVIVNNTFIHRYNFNTTNIINVRNSTVWAHDPVHREGVPYAKQDLREQYRANVRQNVAPRPAVEPYRAPGGQQMERMGSRDVPRNAPPVQNRSVWGGMENNGSAVREHADHGYSSLGPARSAPAPRAEAPRQPARQGPPPGGGRRGR